MAVVNSATVIFGAKLAVTGENLNVYLPACRPSEPILCTSNMVLLTSFRQNTKPGNKQNRKKGRFCGYHKEKKSFGPIISKGNQKISKPFQQHFCQLECKLTLDQLVKT